ncbi:DUF4175 domain-containing protein [Aestuariibius sp. 2305UL40-4]|uniref:DUF4175 domain-containing protein n=1 Tax=Aestuariibius violaceus TaxID=3234132 RepID=UPI00398EA0C0
MHWPIFATRLGFAAERIVRAFWPLWIVLASILAALLLGWQDTLPVEVVWVAAVLLVLAAVLTGMIGIRRFDWPTREEAIERLDATMPGRPIAALRDNQAVGATDPASRAVWDAHQRRMAERARMAKPAPADLRLSRRDPYGLRYLALLFLVVGLLFGSFLRVGSVSTLGVPGGADALAEGPVWEGWVEPPAYTGKPTLYLADIPPGTLEVPVNTRITLRVYGEVGALTVTETVSARTEDVGSVADPTQSFDVTQAGRIAIDGPGGAAWNVALIDDLPPTVEVAGPVEADAMGEMSQPFAASDDYEVVAGTATIVLNLDAVDRNYGLATDPDPREPLILDLPMPFTGDRAEFEEALIENLSEHPFARLPVTLTLEVEDALGQIGQSESVEMVLPGRGFFQPVARAVVEQRRDLLWSRDNATRVLQVLKAVSNRPEDLFRSDTTYLRLRFVLRRLENMVRFDQFNAEEQQEIADALWELAIQLEEGTLADARERLRRAQERLSEAIRNGASQEEIAELMQELREATDDYMQMLADQMEPQDGTDQPSQNAESFQFTQDELQALMDRIQELMEEGRMAEAQELLEQYNRLMENLQITQGQQGSGGPQTPGEQAIEDLAETLRDQQGLSDQAFRDLQEQFNPDANSGESQENRGQSGGLGEAPQGQEHQGGSPQQGDGNAPQQGGGQQGQRQGQQSGQGQGGADQPGGRPGPDGQDRTGDGDGSLADRQDALRRELERQRGNLPGAGTPEGDAARESLGRAGRAMDDAEDALRRDDLAEAIDRQAEAMDALRDGIRSLNRALAENQQQQEGQGQEQGSDMAGRPSGDRRDPLGREAGSNGQLGTAESLLGSEELRRRAGEIMDEIRRRSSEQERPEEERRYLRRLLERF